MTKKELENKILEALQDKMERLAKYDAEMQKLADEEMKKAEAQTDNYWKKDFERHAYNFLVAQKHGYDFIESWKNEIAVAMFEKMYYEWHSAQAGKGRIKGHGSYVTTELKNEEVEITDKVFDNLVNKGYLKLSKSGKMATLKRVGF